MFDNHYKDEIAELEKDNKALKHENGIQSHKLNHRINVLKSSVQSSKSKLHNAIKHGKHVSSKTNDLQDQVKDLREQLKDTHMIPLNNFDKYYVIYNGASATSCRDVVTTSLVPTFWINDTTDFHTGTINYDHDLIRKIFTKDDLKMFYKAFSKKFSYPHNLVKQLKRNTMTLEQAKKDHLILTSDYTKSYSGHVLHERMNLQRAMRRDNNDPLCPSDLGTI